MKNITTLKYTIITLSISLLLTNTSLLSASEKCDYYNEQFDKYSRLADATPDAFQKKIEYIKKMDFYDMQIFHDDTCDMKKMKPETISDDLFESIFH